MAEEALVRFGYIKENEVDKAIEQELISAWSVVFTSDSKRIFLIDDNLSKIALKSQVPIYSSTTSAVEAIQEDSSAYVGEIISIYNAIDECFDAYVVNKWDDGTWYVKPISDKSDLDYNRMANIPIKNLESSVTSPVNLTTLTNGYYKVSYFISPSTGNQINSIVGDIIIIDNPTINTKVIKRISTNNIYDYYIAADNSVTVKQYVTDQYLIDNDYQTGSDVDLKLEAFKLVVQQMIETYVRTTVEYLVRHIVSEEIDSREATDEDIENMFNN